MIEAGTFRKMALICYTISRENLLRRAGMKIIEEMA